MWQPNEVIDAAALVARATEQRRKTHQARRMLENSPTSFGWVKRYVQHSAAVEEAELQLMRMKQRGSVR